MMWFVSRMLVAVLAGAGAVVLATSACGGTKETREVEFRIYDPTGKVDTQITTADIDRSSAGVLPLENLRASVYVDFTDSGTSKFCRLSRSLAIGVEQYASRSRSSSKSAVASEGESQSTTSRARTGSAQRREFR